MNEGEIMKILKTKLNKNIMLYENWIKLTKTGRKLFKELGLVIVIDV